MLDESLQLDDKSNVKLISNQPLNFDMQKVFLLWEI